MPSSPPLSLSPPQYIIYIIARRRNPETGQALTKLYWANIWNKIVLFCFVLGVWLLFLLLFCVCACVCVCVVAVVFRGVGERGRGGGGGVEERGRGGGGG